MLDQFLKLLERFVVAHELIAANSAKQTVYRANSAIRKALKKGIPVEGEDIVDTTPAEEEKPKRKPRKAKVEEPVQEEKEEIDYQSLRDQIQAIDDAISEGPSDAACEDSDDLLEEFTGKKMKIAAIKDEDLAEYLKRLTAIKNKYFEEK
ncbi:13.88 kDa late protein [Salmonella phage ZCSE7]|nr:13.88 kDa late protein [Salmonella phage ZCSE7]